MTAASPKLTVVLPFYNEAESLPRVATELLPVLSGLGLGYEIVAVDDGSTDDSKRVALELKDRVPGLRLLDHPVNRGLGAAVRTGFAAASGDYIVTFQANFTNAPAQIAGLIIKQMETGADCVATTMCAAKDSPLAHRIGAGLLNRAFRLWAGPYDGWTPLFRLYKADAVKPLSLTSDGTEINAEILVELLRAGKKIVEVPGQLLSRREGVTKSTMLKELKDHAALTLRLTLLRN
jgi:dolichol-phosphate mannosyltransferase